MVLMAQKRSRAAARKVRDKWKSKAWYQVKSPDMFNRKVIGEIPSSEPENLNDRVISSTLQELTGDFSKSHIKVSFKVYEVRGSTCYTKFIGHDLTSDYIRRLTRRKRSKTDGVFEIETRDKYLIRVKPMAITDTRIQSSQQNGIRKKMQETIEEFSEMTHSEFISNMLSGELSKKIARNAKIIHPLQRVEIRRSEVLRHGELPPIIEEDEEEEKAEEEKEEGAEEEIEGEEIGEGVLEEEAEAEEEEMKLEEKAEVEAEEMLKEEAEEE